VLLSGRNAILRKSRLESSLVNPLRATDGLIARDIDRLNVLAALDSILVRRPARGLFSIHEEGAALDSCAYFLAVHRVCRDESGETNLPPNAFLRTPNDR
jgi:hypothetical protein